MNSSYNYRKFSLMYVDDEVQTLSNFKAYFSDTFDVVVANSGEEAWSLFCENKDRYGIIMTDQRMPNGTGVEFLEKVRLARPRVLRILATAYSDLDAAISAVNTGAIYKYVTKPWDPPTMEMTLKRGMEFFLVQRELDALMKEKMSALQRLMMTDRLLSLGVFAAGLNHHLRNSLTAVKTFLDLTPFQLQSEKVDISSLRSPNYWGEFYETVQHQMRKVVGLLESINQIPESVGVPLLDSVSVNELVQAASQQHLAALGEKQIELKFGLEQVPQVQANRPLLERGLNLLIADECANVPASGKIVITTSAAVDANGCPGVKIEISDNGPGITASNLSCVFDPFFVRRSDPKEYGLNLLTCFFVVYHHNGTMTVDRSAEGGARFQIFLPEQATVQDARQEQTFLERVLDMEKTCEQMLIGL
ncbi:MAG: hybrid sensor histidine kinase/response regulator [Verrucomicrobiota bacterium]